MNNITIHKKFSIIINLLHVRFTGFPFYLASLHQLNTAKPALPRSLLARSWTLVWVGLEEQLQSVWAGGDHSKVTVPQILCWGCWWLLLPQCAVCLGFLQMSVRVLLHPDLCIFRFASAHHIWVCYFWWILWTLDASILFSLIPLTLVLLSSKSAFLSLSTGELFIAVRFPVSACASFLIIPHILLCSASCRHIPSLLLPYQTSISVHYIVTPESSI